MQLDIISYSDLTSNPNPNAVKLLINALYTKGIVGIADVPEFEGKSRDYVNAARAFAQLPENVKRKYSPNRDAGETGGYELGQEKFLNRHGEWITDDKKASYYAFVPNNPRNRWPQEVDLESAYLALGKLIFATGQVVLNTIGLNHVTGISLDKLVGYGRLLHYQKEGEKTNDNPNWCGAHFDHGVFTGLMPAYYFLHGQEIPEPNEAGLYIKPSNSSKYEKIDADQKSVMLFQVGEFGQLAANDKIKATHHLVKKAYGEIERFTFALFYSASNDTIITSRSELTRDSRYSDNKSTDGSITYAKWQQASYQRYRVK